MMVRIQCPNHECNAQGTVEEGLLGRRCRCLKCKQSFEMSRMIDEVIAAPQSVPPVLKSSTEVVDSPPSVPAALSSIPAQIGRYQIIRRLGQGGMGVVYLARDSTLGRVVALKLPYFKLEDRRLAIQRFEREARVAATLDHPNLCPIYDFGEADGHYYLVMPFFDGKSLAEAIVLNETLPIAQVIALVQELALALQDAHDRGVVHRDLKPSNIMVNHRGDLVIMDFGLARLADADEVSLTSSSFVLGSALYMAPEQASGTSEMNQSTVDVYSLGVIFYELLTCVRPFEGPGSVVLGLKQLQDASPPSNHRPEIHARVDEVCLKAVARHPADRYTSMYEFFEALETCSFPLIHSTRIALEFPRSDQRIRSTPIALFSNLRTDDQSSLQVRPATKFKNRSQIASLLSSPARKRFALTGVAVLSLLLGGLAFVGNQRNQIKSNVDDPGAVVQIDDVPIGTKAALGPILPHVGADDLSVNQFDGTPDTQRVVGKPGSSQNLIIAQEIYAASSSARVTADPNGLVYSSRGTWTIEGNDLCQGSLAAGVMNNPMLVFGDKEWSDYDLTLVAEKEEGKEGFLILFHWQDDSNFCQLGLGTYDNTVHDMRSYVNRNYSSKDFVPLRGRSIDAGVPYTLKIKVRGNRCTAYLNGELLFDQVDLRYDRGRIGLATWQSKTRFRRISIQAPAGNVLFAGLPELASKSKPIPAQAKLPNPQIFQGSWAVVGTTLEEIEQRRGSGQVYQQGTAVAFGDPTWSEYEFSFQGKVVNGVHGIKARFHYTSADNYCEFAIGNYSNRLADISFSHDGTWGRNNLYTRPKPIEPGRWYDIKIRVRGADVICSVDGEEYFAAHDDRFTRGRVGFSTWDTKAQFRDIKIRALDGRLLWENPPSLKTL